MENKLERYYEAKEAYYNGEEVMSDAEFDMLERELGLENNAYVGSKSEKYTQKHSYIMGSLNKVHVEKDKADNSVNFQFVAEKVTAALNKAHFPTYIEITPKLDGCSFSIEFDEKGEIVDVITRGDGLYGKDIKDWFFASMRNTDFVKNMGTVASSCFDDCEDDFNPYRFVVRGEILVKKSVFSRKYAVITETNKKVYKNTRSFVSSCVNSDYEDTEQYREKALDLDWICYDFRLVNKEGTDYREYSYITNNPFKYKLLSVFSAKDYGDKTYYFTPNEKYALVLSYVGIFHVNVLKTIYDMFEKYRYEITDYSLDGIVVKPSVESRLHNFKERPDESIAIKFLPEIVETEVIGIDWSVGKSGECYPRALVKTVKLDGKDVNYASLYGYSTICEDHVGVGSKIKITLSGDIIPMVCEVITEGEIVMPDFETRVEMYADKNTGKQTPHLMKVFSDEDFIHHKFMTSVKALNVPKIGQKVADVLWNECKDEYKRINGADLTNLMCLMNEDMYSVITEKMGALIDSADKKSVKNIVESLENYRRKMSLADVVLGQCFDKCGESTSEICARIMSGISYDLTGLNADAYSWALDKESAEYKQTEKFMDYLCVKYMQENKMADDAELINVILTGEPSNTSYKTKKEWLNAHPQYKVTTSWKEVQILFTNDLNGSSSKMKKAADKGVEIRMYED